MADHHRPHLGEAVTADESEPVSVRAFSRQVNLDDFDDAVMAKQRCLIVGSGGVGSCVGLTLARTGVAHITFVDVDTVAASNLNRQLLFSPDQIGMPKAAACKATVDSQHATRTTTEAIDTDAVANWGAIVDAAVSGKITAMFNGCDYGGMFDLALQSLARSLDEPASYQAAATYAYTHQVEVFRPTGICLACTAGAEHPMLWSDFSEGAEGAPVTEPEVLEVLWRRYKSRHDLLPGMVRRAITSAVAQCPGAAEAAIPGLAVPAFPRTQACFNAFRSALVSEIVEQLRPSRIRDHDSLTFIPASPKPATATVGSWAPVCGIGSMFLVSCWAQSLNGADVPTMTISILKALSGPSWRQTMGWESFKAHPEPEDGCWLCGYADPGPSEEELAEASAKEEASRREAEARKAASASVRAAAVSLAALALAGAAVSSFWRS